MKRSDTSDRKTQENARVCNRRESDDESLVTHQLSPQREYDVETAIDGDPGEHGRRGAPRRGNGMMRPLATTRSVWFCSQAPKFMWTGLPTKLSLYAVKAAAEMIEAENPSIEEAGPNYLDDPESVPDTTLQ